MTVNALLKLLMQAQAHLYQGLSYIFTDSYDVIRYDSHIHRLLGEANIDYQTYTTLPWLDYCSPALEVWTVFAMQHDEWIAVQLPNPFSQPSQPHASTTLSVEVM